MKMKKLMAIGLAAAMSVSMLAGCGASSSSDDETESTAKTEAAEDEDAAEDSGDEDGAAVTAEAGSYNTQAIEEDGDITITMMVSGTAYENDFETEVLPKLIKEKWPNVTLEATKLPDDNYYTSLKTKLASGECPDIINVQPMSAGNNAVYTLAEAGYLAPLDDMTCLTLNGDNSGMTYNGHIYGITGGVAILGTYYNKDIFEECGITSEPQTWQEFLDDCQKIQDAGYQPIVMGDKDQYVIQFGLYQLAAEEIYSKNSDYDSQLLSGDAKFTDEDTWDRVLEMYKELYDKKYIDASQSLGLSASQAITEFIDGKAAMTIDGSFNVSAIMAEGAAGSFERGYFPLPGQDGINGTATCLAGGFAVYSGSQYVDEIKEIMDWVFDGQSDGWKAFLASGRNIVTYGEGADSTPNYDLFKPFVDLLQDGKAYHWCNQAWPGGVDNTMEELFSEMVGGQGTTVEDVTEGMQEKLEDLLDE